jgi:hypothetical protein
VCGGLTTFSAFATDLDRLVRSGLGTAAGYGAVTVGAALALAGIGRVAGERLGGNRLSHLDARPDLGLSPSSGASTDPGTPGPGGGGGRS